MDIFWHMLTPVSFSGHSRGNGVSNFYWNKFHVQKLYQNKNSHHIDNHVYYIRSIRIKSSHSLSQTFGTVGVHPAIAISLSYKSSNSPSVVSKSSSWHEKTFHRTVDSLFFYVSQSHKLELWCHLFTHKRKHWVMQVGVCCTSTSCQPCLCWGHYPLPSSPVRCQGHTGVSSCSVPVVIGTVRVSWWTYTGVIIIPSRCPHC